MSLAVGEEKKEEKEREKVWPSAVTKSLILDHTDWRINSVKVINDLRLLRPSKHYITPAQRRAILRWAAILRLPLEAQEKYYFSSPITSQNKYIPMDVCNSVTNKLEKAILENEKKSKDEKLIIGSLTSTLLDSSLTSINPIYRKLLAENGLEETLINSNEFRLGAQNPDTFLASVLHSQALKQIAEHSGVDIETMRDFLSGALNTAHGHVRLIKPYGKVDRAMLSPLSKISLQ